METRQMQELPGEIQLEEQDWDRTLALTPKTSEECNLINL
jgi:hypothetical protein